MTPHIPLLVPGAEPDGEPVSITAPFDGLLARLRGDAINAVLDGLADVGEAVRIVTRLDGVRRKNQVTSVTRTR